MKVGGPLIVKLLENVLKKALLITKFSNSGWAIAHLAHPPTRALERLDSIMTAAIHREMRILYIYK